jgi:hypothetical protein
MNEKLASRVWTASGVAALAVLWIGHVWAPHLVSRLGFVFLCSPFALAGLMLWARRVRDRVTIFCAFALALLFLLAWYV